MISYKPSLKRKEKASITFCYIFLIIMSIISLFPLFWIFSCSLRNSTEIWQRPPQIIPKTFNLTNYFRIFKYTDFTLNLLNTLIIGLSTTTLAILCAIGAGYSISRFRYKGRVFFSRIILTTYMFPPVLLIIPLFIIMVKFSLINTRTGLVLTQLAFCFPYATWLLNAYFSTIPKELEEAAYVDGTTRLGALTKIIIPLALPGIIATSVFSFILSWREFLFAFVIANGKEVRTLSIGLYDQMAGDVMIWGDVLAWSTLMTIPVLIFFTILQKKIVYGMVAGAVKG